MITTRSLGARLLAIFLPIVTVTLVALFFVFEYQYYLNKRAELEVNLANLVSVQESAIAAAVWEVDDDEVQRRLQSIGEIGYIFSANVRDTLGRTIASVNKEQELSAGPAFGKTQELYYGSGTNRELLGVLEVTTHTGEIRKELIEHVQLRILTLVVLILVLSAGTFYATRIVISRPLESLKEAMTMSASSSDHTPLSWSRQDELGDVVFAYNKMQAHRAEAEEQVAHYQTHLESLVAERTKELADLNHIMTSSIDYASRIQRSVLPSNVIFSKWFEDHFTIWQPRDVVGGDIYWCREWGQGILVMLGDCTGHGVPGAFMTLISTGALDQALAQTPEGEVNRLIQHMHRVIQNTLGQDGDEAESDDGLELGACYISADKRYVTFAGARFDLFTVLNGTVERHSGGKKGIGYGEVPADQSFAEVTVKAESATSFYMTTDGTIDQIGETTGRSFGKKRFQKMISSIEHMDMIQQKEVIVDTAAQHQGTATRLDDIAVIGFRLG